MCGPLQPGGCRVFLGSSSVQQWWETETKKNPIVSTAVVHAGINSFSAWVRTELVKEQFSSTQLKRDVVFSGPLPYLHWSGLEIFSHLYALGCFGYVHNFWSFLAAFYGPDGFHPSRRWAQMLSTNISNSLQFWHHPVSPVRAPPVTPSNTAPCWKCSCPVNANNLVPVNLAASPHISLDSLILSPSPNSDVFGLFIVRSRANQ